jgi:hypothetical protein
MINRKIPKQGCIKNDFLYDTVHQKRGQVPSKKYNLSLCITFFKQLPSL